ncbi:hypothetical protein [Aureispira sp. CCB-QB1]|uniref:hypothetical protein n=1 Tax=Aureispira sp. CCB-QB1 TaxID=1313421 RepID=UPI0012DC303A|nr:hypothetical protein [Aureispira sp. CCB-QB1]
MKRLKKYIIINLLILVVLLGIRWHKNSKKVAHTPNNDRIPIAADLIKKDT